MANDGGAIIPNINTKLILPNGQVDPVWFQFFLKLFTRTENGNDPEIEHITILLGALYAQTNSVASPSPGMTALRDLAAFGQSVVANSQAKSQVFLGDVAAHGKQTDEQMHALATQLLAGFMSSADKVILDAMSVGGTWVPTLSCATPGDLVVSYAGRVGTYTKFGRMVVANFLINTSALTWLTASGALVISGLPFTSSGVGVSATPGTVDWSGITKAGYTQIVPEVSFSSTSVFLIANGSGLSRATVNIADTPSGTNLVLVGQVTYFV